MFKDGIARFKCPDTGLWKRYRQWAYVGEKVKKGWGSDGEIHIDEQLGEYTVLTNGVKVYRFVK